MSRFLRPFSRLALIAGLVAQTRDSFADGPNEDQTRKPGQGEVAIVDAEPPANALPKKRPVPDYDGRGEKPKTASDALLWIPRVLAAPFYFVSEYLIRRPLGAVVTAIERDKLTQRFIYILTIGPKRNIGFAPTFYFDDGRMPAAGAYIWWDDAGSTQNHVRGYFATWGEPLIMGTLADRWELDPTTAASLRIAYTHRTDNLFYGIGPDTTSRTESRFETSTIEGGPTFEHRFISAQAGVRDVRYDGDGACCGTAKLLDRVRTGQLPPPPRLLDAGYTSVFQSATVYVDSRSALSRLGGRLALTGAPSFDVSERPGQSWLRYEANAVGSWDVTGTARLLSLGVTAVFVDPILGGSRGIPFTELVTLGGTGPMRGFLTGRLVDRSAAVATLDYQWPIWSFLDGTMQAAIGNVFGAGLQDFALEKLRLSAVFGLRSNASRDHVFEVLTGFGTETIEQGLGATAFRLAFGATHGF
jgi:hypothetical protein